MNVVSTAKIQPRRIHWGWHALIWTLYSCIWIFGMNEAPDIHTVAGQLIFVFFNAGLVYLNAYYLIPNLLNARRIGWYLFVITGALLLASVGLAYAMYFYLEYVCICDGAFFLDPYQAFGPTFGSNVSVLFVSIPIHLYRQRRALQIHQQEQEKNHLKTELKVLKDQLNPHFLFNALNNIYFLIRKNPDQASEALLNLSDLLRYQLYETEGEGVPLEKEMQNLLQFCQLALLRKSDSFSFQTEIESNWNGEKIAPLLLLPLVENAFKHTDHSEGYIKLKAKMIHQFFQFTVENTIVTNVEAKGVGGIGLANLKRRLSLLYPNRYELKIIEGHHSYQVHLTLQLA